MLDDCGQRQFAHRVTLVEDGLLGLTDRIGEVSRVAQQPQVPRALQPGLKPGFG